MMARESGMVDVDDEEEEDLMDRSRQIDMRGARIAGGGECNGLEDERNGIGRLCGNGWKGIGFGQQLSPLDLFPNIYFPHFAFICSLLPIHSSLSPPGLRPSPGEHCSPFCPNKNI